IAATAATAASAPAGCRRFAGFGVGCPRIGWACGIRGLSGGLGAGTAASTRRSSLRSVFRFAFGGVVAAIASAIAVAIPVAAFAAVATTTALGAVGGR